MDVEAERWLAEQLEHHARDAELFRAAPWLMLLDMIREATSFCMVNLPAPMQFLASAGENKTMIRPEIRCRMED